MGMGRASGGQMPTQQSGMGGKGGQMPMQSQRPPMGGMGGKGGQVPPQQQGGMGGKGGQQPEGGMLSNAYQQYQQQQGGMGGKGGQMGGYPPRPQFEPNGRFDPRTLQLMQSGDMQGAMDNQKQLAMQNGKYQPKGGMGGKGGGQQGGTLVGFGPTDMPIYSNDPNAVPYTGGSMGGYFVNGVPGPAPQRPAYTGGQQPQMTQDQMRQMFSTLQGQQTAPVAQPVAAAPKPFVPQPVRQENPQQVAQRAMQLMANAKRGMR